MFSVIVNHYTRLSSLLLFFFFKQKTAYEMRISDWSSDVCSSDLHPQIAVMGAGRARAAPDPRAGPRHGDGGARPSRRTRVRRAHLADQRRGHRELQAHPALVGKGRAAA